MQTPRATLDRLDELGDDAPARRVDDWTAGDEPDFVVRPGARRRRITGASAAADPAGAPATTPRAPEPHVRPARHDHAAAPRRTVVVEGDVTPTRRVDSWLDDDLDILAGVGPDRTGRAGRRSPAHAPGPHARARPADAGPVSPDEEWGSAPATRADDPYAAAPADDPYAEPPADGRRTVTIKGRPERLHAGPPLRELERRRPAPRPSERVGSRPDRIAMWAVALGFALILIAAASSKAEAATTLGDRTLKEGMVGRDVRHLQLRLKRLDLLQAPATARFGSLTRTAVVRYQRSRCLEDDGVVGPGTVRALRAGKRRCRSRSGATRPASSGSDRRRYRRVHLGDRTVARGMAGRDVRTVQRLLGVRSTGVFGPLTQRAVRGFQRRAGLGVDGAVGPATKSALVRREMRVRRVTYFGPGLYGNRTACGQTLTKRLPGVAHRTLPCGTPVTLHHAGRFVTVKVVDRGPFVRGVVYDLTAATARALGVRSTLSLRAAAN